MKRSENDVPTSQGVPSEFAADRCRSIGLRRVDRLHYYSILI